MTNQNIQLTMEQKFHIASFKQQVESMSEAQAKEFLIKLHEQLIVTQATYQELLKHQWGLELPDSMG